MGNEGWRRPCERWVDVIRSHGIEEATTSCVVPGRDAGLDRF